MTWVRFGGKSITAYNFGHFAEKQKSRAMPRVVEYFR